MPRVGLVELSRQAQAIRSLIRKSVESYPLEWIVIHETIQNAIDAIQVSKKSSGTVQIYFDIDQNEVRIDDNGRGFPFDLSLLGFGGTDKDPTNFALGGDIGVGLSAVILSTQLFTLESIFKKGKWTCTIQGALRYLKGQADEVPIDYTEPTPIKDDTRTSLRYSLPSVMVSEFIQGVYDEHAMVVSDRLAATELQKFKIGLEHHFRTRSYAGNLHSLLGTAKVKPVEISVSVSCTTNKALEKIRNDRLREILRNNSPITTNFPAKQWDIEEAVNKTLSGKSRPAVISPDWRKEGDIGQYNKNYVCVEKFTKKKDFAKLLQNQYLREPINVNKYRPLFAKLDGIYLVIGSTEMMREYMAGVIGIPQHFVAASGIPSSHDIRKPARGGLHGLLNNMRFIVNLKEKLNYGKQTISNTRLVGLVNDFFEDAYRATLRNAAQAIVGAPEDITARPVPFPARDIVSREDLGFPKLSIIKQPANETEVIALFYELIGRGYLDEYRTYALLPRWCYDGKIMFKYKGKFGIPGADGEIPNTEFKFKVSSLIGDLEEGPKRSTDLNLLIAWENDWKGGHKRYEVIDVRGTEIEDFALAYAKTCLHDRYTGHKILMLILKDVIEELKERES